MNGKVWRWVVCLDIQADSLVDAYGRLWKELGDLDERTQGSIQWESTDEAFNPDGDQLLVKELEACRTAFFDSLP